MPGMTPVGSGARARRVITGTGLSIRSLSRLRGIRPNKSIKLILFLVLTGEPLGSGLLTSVTITSSLSGSSSDSSMMGVVVSLGCLLGVLSDSVKSITCFSRRYYVINRYIKEKANLHHSSVV